MLALTSNGDQEREQRRMISVSGTEIASRMATYSTISSAIDSCLMTDEDRLPAAAVWLTTMTPTIRPTVWRVKNSGSASSHRCRASASACARRCGRPPPPSTTR